MASIQQRRKLKAAKAADSLPTAIMARVQPAGRGKRVYTADDFRDLGSQDAVRQALSRLVKDGVLRRVGRGFYDRPRHNALLDGPAPPKISDIADAIARQRRLRLLDDGLQAANKLGLTNAVSVRPVFVTDGPDATVKVGATKIKLKRASPKVMAWAGRKGSLVIQALSHLGRKLVQTDPSIMATLHRRLPNDIKASLARQATDAPAAWMIPYLQQLGGSEGE